MEVNDEWTANGDIPEIEIVMTEGTPIVANPRPVRWIQDNTEVEFWANEVVTAQPMMRPTDTGIFRFIFNVGKEVGIKLSEFKFTDWEFK